MKILKPKSPTNQKEDSSDSYIILSNSLKGFFNKMNPFRSHIIFTKQSILVKNLINLNPKNSSFQNQSSTAFCVNNFMILNDDMKKSEMPIAGKDSHPIKNSLNKKIALANGTGSSSFYFGNLSKYSNSIYKRSILQSDGVSPRVLNQLARNKILCNQNSISENLITNVDKFLKKTRTPILQFIDNKNFVIAGSNYLRVYHLSETLWYCFILKLICLK